MHPADRQELDKLTQERADLRRIVNNLKEDLRRAKEKIDLYRREVKRLAEIG